jgi:hypothetical protein
LIRLLVAATLVTGTAAAEAYEVPGHAFPWVTPVVVQPAAQWTCLDYAVFIASIAKLRDDLPGSEQAALYVTRSVRAGHATSGDLILLSDLLSVTPWLYRDTGRPAYETFFASKQRCEERGLPTLWKQGAR